MRFFRGRSVRAKLFGGSGVVLLLTVVVGVVLWAAYVTQTARIEVLGVGAASTGAIALINASAPAYAAFQHTLNSWGTANVTWANQKLKSNNSTFSSARTMGVALLVIAVVIGAGIAFLISQQIRRSVAAIKERLEIIKVKGADRLVSQFKITT